MGGHNKVQVVFLGNLYKKMNKMYNLGHNRKMGGHYRVDLV